VRPYVTKQSFGSLLRFRVEGIAASLDLKVKLKPLRHAVKKLHKASVKLDKEKHEAEEHLRDIIKDWQHHRPSHNHRCGPRWWRISRWVKSVFGAVNRDAYELDGANKGSDSDIHSPQPDSSLASVSHHPHPHHPPHRLIKAVKRVQAVNKKLSSFEGGFISKEGIAGREWYKHLAVAPGKWLG
jgi:N-acetylated-alpha-linked acidic dipeptidase